MINVKEAYTKLKKEWPKNDYILYTEYKDMYLFCAGDVEFWATVNKKTGETGSLSHFGVMMESNFNDAICDEITDAVNSAKEIDF